MVAGPLSGFLLDLATGEACGSLRRRIEGNEMLGDCHRRSVEGSHKLMRKQMDGAVVPGE